MAPGRLCSRPGVCFCRSCESFGKGHHFVLSSSSPQAKRQVLNQMLRKTLPLLIVVAAFLACEESEVDSIVVGDTLCHNCTYQRNKELEQLIRLAMKRDDMALSKLISFPCGGGAGCYDLGFVITQIIHKLGERKFILMAKKLERAKLPMLEGLIVAGLEYGDNDNDGSADNKRMETEFPELNKVLME